MSPYLLSALALCCSGSSALECAGGCCGRAGGLEDGAVLLQRSAEAEPGFEDAARLDLQQSSTGQRVESSFAKLIANHAKSEVKAALKQTKEFWAKEAEERRQVQQRMRSRTAAMREAWKEDGKEKKLRREREQAVLREDDAAKAAGTNAAQPRKAAEGKPTPKPAHPAQKDDAAKAAGTNAAQPRQVAEVRPTPKPAHPAQKESPSTMRLAKPALTHLPIKSVSHSYKKPGNPAQKPARDAHLPAKTPVKPAKK